jgi:DNA-binding MarR family transcriptional regulator
MKLADLAASEGTGQPALLKQLYLELPYSEKGIRLHLRRLEATGWITVQKGGADGRGARIQLSAEYWELLTEYETQWSYPGAPEIE